MKAVIFDMDGVIIDSEPVYLNYFFEPFVKYNQNVNIQDIYSIIGTTVERTWEILADAWKPNKTVSEIIDLYDDNEIQTLVNDYEDIKMPHLEFLMKSLKDHGVKLAIASGSPLQVIEKVMKSLSLERYISFYISGEEVKASKPSPDVYLETMRALDVLPENTIVIEDSDIGIEAAKKAGTMVLAYKDHRFGMDQSQADHFVCDHIESFHTIARLFNLGE